MKFPKLQNIYIFSLSSDCDLQFGEMKKIKNELSTFNFYFFITPKQPVSILILKKIKNNIAFSARALKI